MVYLELSAPSLESWQHASSLPKEQWRMGFMSQFVIQEASTGSEMTVVALSSGVGLEIPRHRNVSNATVIPSRCLERSRDIFARSLDHGLTSCIRLGMWYSVEEASPAVP